MWTIETYKKTNITRKIEYENFKYILKENLSQNKIDFDRLI